jgi:hypothetical protein
VFNDSAFVESLTKEFGRRVPEYFLYDENAPDPCEITGKIRERYIKGAVVDAESFSKIFDDRSDQGLIRSITDYSKLTDVYAYNFTKSRSGSKSYELNQFLKTCSKDLKYYFSTEYFP